MTKSKKIVHFLYLEGNEILKEIITLQLMSIKKILLLLMLLRLATILPRPNLENAGEVYLEDYSRTIFADFPLFPEIIGLLLSK